ncbi:MAG: YhdT family protein [Anaerovibrio sp.]|nr:YhdT family protein [Anaerovibrio sp.]
MTEKEKYLQIRKEAMWTGITLVVLILFWLVAGFGLSDVDIKIFGLPIWAVGGTVGVWIFAMILVKLLTAFVFKDFDLDATGEEDKS